MRKRNGDEREREDTQKTEGRCFLNPHEKKEEKVTKVE
jgi:hypothetical protein